MSVPARLKDHLEKLRILNAVARSGSITKAAALLHMTQPAVSQSIKTLEQALNHELIIREPKGIGLTERGRILFEFSKKLLLEIESIEARLEDPNEMGSGSLRMGTHETLAIHVWPNVLNQFSKRCPNVSVSLLGGRIDALVTALINYELHMILTVEPESRPDIESVVLYKGRLRFYGNGSLPESLSMQEANRLPILTDAAAHARQGIPILSLLIGQGFDLSRFHELNSFEAAMRFAALGLGIALVPDRNAAESVATGRLRELTIEGIDPQTFGAYKICASWLRKNADYKPLSLFRESLNAQFSLS